MLGVHIFSSAYRHNSPKSMGYEYYRKWFSVTLDYNNTYPGTAVRRALYVDTRTTINTAPPRNLGKNRCCTAAAVDHTAATTVYYYTSLYLVRLEWKFDVFVQLCICTWYTLGTCGTLVPGISYEYLSNVHDIIRANSSCTYVSCCIPGIWYVCVLHIKPFFLLVDIQHTQWCPR